MNNVARRILELKKADVVDLQAEHPAEEKMPSLVHNHAGKRQHCNYYSRNEKHAPSTFSLSRSFEIFCRIPAW